MNHNHDGHEDGKRGQEPYPQPPPEIIPDLLNWLRAVEQVHERRQKSGDDGRDGHAPANE